MARRTVQVLSRLPPELYDRVVVVAQSRGQSINTWIVEVLAMAATVYEGRDSPKKEIAA